MNREIMKQAGFHTEVARIEAGRCPWCDTPIDQGAFWDALSRTEFMISGLCQDCQDEFFVDKGD